MRETRETQQVGSQASNAQSVGAQAQYDVGIAYYHGRGVGRDLYKAEQCFQKAALQGNVEAQCALGDLFADDRNPQVDVAQAMQWYSKAAENGHAKAQWLMGAGCFNGIGVEKDMEQARFWFQKSADQGNADGQYGLGGYYLTMQNYAEAERWLKKAAAQRHEDAMAMLEAMAPLFR